MPLKIVHSSFSKIPSLKANSVQVMKVCESLAKKGHEVELIVPQITRKRSDPVFEFYGILNRFRIIRTLPLNILTSLIHALYVALRAKKNGYDIVYTRETVIAFFTLLLGDKTVIECHLPLSAECHSIKNLFSVRNLIKLIQAVLFRFVIKSPNLIGIVVISEALRNHYCNSYNLPYENVIVLRSGADEIQCFKKHSSDIKNLTAAYAGNLYPGRGMEIIISLAENFPDISFLVIGGDETAVNKYRKKCSHCGNLLFYGFVKPSSVSDYLCSSDILIAPYGRKVSTKYNGEGNTADFMSPIKIFEYMACRKAILTSDLPALREFLTNNENALLCDPDSLNDWIEALSKLKKDHALRERLGENAHKKFTANFTWDIRAQKITELLEKSFEQR
jgi:glycosyltransferase involved in cell wall biosynthesis